MVYLNRVGEEERAKQVHSQQLGRDLEVGVGREIQQERLKVAD
jgi:hypothetical protein